MEKKFDKKTRKMGFLEKQNKKIIPGKINSN